VVVQVVVAAVMMQAAPMAAVLAQAVKEMTAVPVKHLMLVLVAAAVLAVLVELLEVVMVALVVPVLNG
jgi:hypothetical protein